MENDHNDHQHCGDDSDHRHCLEMFNRLSEYLDNELDDITCREIEQHVEKCVPCFSCLQTLKQTVALCKQTTNKPVPKEFSRKLRELIQNIPKTTIP